MSYRIMQARYSGTCPNCGGRIEAGDTIRYEAGKAYHADRADDGTCYGVAVEAAPAVDPEVVEAGVGYYVRGAEGDREVFHVQLNREGTRTYARKLVIRETAGGRHSAKWEWAPGVKGQLDGRDILTLDEARALGRLYGICMICGRQLTVPKHAEAGIGPKCVLKLGGYAPQPAAVASSAAVVEKSPAEIDAEMDAMVRAGELAEDRRVAEFKYRRDLALEAAARDQDRWLELDPAGRDCDGVYYETGAGGWDHR